MTNCLSTFRNSFRLKFFSAMSLTLLADFLFYGYEAGWTSGLFGLLLIGALAIHNPGTLETRAGRIISLLIIVQCGLLVEKTSLLSVCLIAVGTVSLAIFSKGGWQKDAMAWLGKLASFFLFLLHPLSKAAIAYIKYQRRFMPHNTLEIFMRGWLLPILLSFVFLLLFSSANPVITRWVSLLDAEFVLRFLSLGRLFFWVLAGSAIFAVIRPKLMAQKVKKPKAQADTNGPQPMRFTEWAFTKEAVLRSLVIFNLMFACQTALDINYLWAGAELPKGITYAKYAQQGAYPLIVTALLAAAFVLITQNAGPEVSGSKPVRGMIYVWVLQNVLLVVSSIYRTNMYVEVYALTYWRVAAFIWMGLVASGLCWIIVRSILNKSNTWLINANVLTLLGVLYVTSFVNIGGIIAHHNVIHAREISGKGAFLDVPYLEGIGSAAIPALMIYSERLKDPFSPSFPDQTNLPAMHRTLQRDMDDLRRWTYSEYRLLKSLESQTK